MLYWYLVITIYPLKGSSYPKTYLISHDEDGTPIKFYKKIYDEIMELPLSQRPYRVVLTFFSKSEISTNDYKEFKDLIALDGRGE